MTKTKKGKFPLFKKIMNYECLKCHKKFEELYCGGCPFCGDDSIKLLKQNPVEKFTQGNLFEDSK